MAKSLDGLHPTLMRPRVEAVLADPQAKALGLYVVSAFRSIEKQRYLWEAALKKYGSAEIADNWVARPGTSNHGPKVDGYGVAVDFGVPGYKAVAGQWPTEIESKVNAVCARHGLASPMAWEDWHFEPIPNWKPRMTPTPAPAKPPTPQEIMMRVKDPAGFCFLPNRDLVVVDKSGGLYYFDEDGQPDDREWEDAYNVHPEWWGGPDPQTNRTCIGVATDGPDHVVEVFDDGATYRIAT